MIQISPHPNLRPHFLSKALLFSKHSYLKFLKNRPRHLKKLQVERFTSIDDELKDFKAIGIHIKRLTQSTKSIQHVDLTQFPQKSIPNFIHKDMLKRFLKIKKLTQICTPTAFKSLYINYLYIKRLKNLRSLALVGPDWHFRREVEDIKEVSWKFFQYLQKIKLGKFEWKLGDKQPPSYNLVNFPQYPSSLEACSVSCGSNPLVLREMKNIHQLLNLTHMKNLKAFQIQTPLTIDLFIHLLESLPQQIQTLAFNIQTNLFFKMALQERKKYQENFKPVTTRLRLAKFLKLEHLSMTLSPYIDVFSMNESRLKSLTMDTEIFHVENLMGLKGLIGQHETSLESLNLKICFKAENDPKALSQFIEKICEPVEVISRLKKLKVLSLTFTIFSDWGVSRYKLPAQEGLLSSLSVLINGLNEMKDLRELRLNHDDADFRTNFEGFFGAIQKRSNRLEVLEITLNGYHIKEKDLGILVKSLAHLKFLEVLKLRDFCVDDAGFFERFAEAVHRCSRLRSLEISNYRMSFMGCNPKGVLKMFRRIFSKDQFDSYLF